MYSLNMDIQPKYQCTASHHPAPAPILSHWDPCKGQSMDTGDAAVAARWPSALEGSNHGQSLA